MTKVESNPAEWDYTKEVSKNNYKFIAAAVAAGLALAVMILKVEIDSTIENLILALSPIIVGYLWPPITRRLKQRVAREDATNVFSVDQDVWWALAVALVLYVVALLFLDETQVPLIGETGEDFAIALGPVVVGALTPPA